MTLIASLFASFPGSQVTHLFTLSTGGRVYRTTLGEGVRTNCGTFPELRTKEDLARKLQGQGYEVSEA